MAADLKGMAELEKRLKQAMSQAEQAIGAGLYAEAQNILADAKEKVPLETGTLSRSHYATLPTVDKGRVMVEIGCGGPAEDYAVVQHEDTSLQHKDGREAKWFQNAYNRAMAHFRQNVTDVAREAFASGKGATKGSQPLTPDESKG